MSSTVSVPPSRFPVGRRVVETLIAAPVRPIDRDRPLIDRDHPPIDRDRQPSDREHRPIGRENRPTDREHRPTEPRSTGREQRPTDREPRPTDREPRPTGREYRPTDRDQRPTDRNRQASDRGRQPPDLDRFSSTGPSVRTRVSRALTRFLIIFCFGAATTLALQSYSDELRATIANSSPRLAWLAPAVPVAQTPHGRGMIAPGASGAPPPDLEEFDMISRDLATMSRDLAGVRQSIDQLAVAQQQIQQQMTREITKLQVTRQDTFDRTLVPPSVPSSGPAVSLGTMPVVVTPVRRPPPVVQVPAQVQVAPR